MLILADENFPLPTVEAMRAVGHDVLCRPDRAVDREQGNYRRGGRGGRQKNRPRPAANDPEFNANSLAWLYYGIGGTRQHGANRWLQVLSGAGRLCPPASRANRTARRRTRTASCASRHWTTETLVDGNTPGCSVC